MTLVPVMSYAPPKEGGAFLVFGIDHLEMLPAVQGLVPVMVEHRMEHQHRSRQALHQWQRYFEWLFRVPQPADGLDFHVTTDYNKDLAAQISNMYSYLEEEYTADHAMGHTPFKRLMERYLMGLGVYPRRVVDSPCRRCVNSEGWVLTISWALWSSDGRAPLGRWNALMPSNPEREEAELSHPCDHDHLLDKLMELWAEDKHSYDGMIPGAGRMTLEEAFEADSSQELEHELTAEINREVGTLHASMWFAPDGLLGRFKDAMRSNHLRLGKQDDIVSRMMDLESSPDPFYIWGEALQNERNAGRNF